MARFYFDLRSSIGGARAHGVVSHRSLKALNLIEDDEGAQGPGWFDSSWELIRGLEVREGTPGDARLNEWLAACRRCEREPDAASTVAQRHEQPGARLVPAAPHGALGDALQFGDLDFAVAAEVTHLDEFSEFGIDGLELV